MKLSKVVDNNVIKKKCTTNLAQKSMVFILKFQVVVKQSLKSNMPETKKALRK